MAVLPRFIVGSVSFGLALLLGCASYTFVQANVFADDDGRLVEVEYWRADKDHVNTFLSPVNGKEMEFRSRLVVRVLLPDGNRIVAWQCMNFLRQGTMYETDNHRWKVLVNGFSTLLFQREPDGRYREVYRGVLCDSRTTPAGMNKDERWRTLPASTSKSAKR